MPFALSDDGFKAVCYGDLGKVKNLIASGLDLTYVEEGTRLQVMHLCFMDDGIAESDRPVEFLRFLVDGGADINAQDVYSNSPLYYAVRGRSNPKIVEALLELGADPNMKCEKGRTPLRRSFVKRPYQWELAALMVAAGGDGNEPNERGVSVKDLVMKRARDDERHWLSIFDSPD